MDFLTTIRAFVLVLGVIIFFHEFGHFITAKMFGMRVFIFSFGFGRRLFGFKWGDTDCRVSLIPLGGYVKLEGEADDVVSEDTSALGDSRAFAGRPRWQRFLVYLAGPFMNGVLTVVVFTVLYMVGFGVDATLSDRPVIGAVDAGSPAEAARLQPGDEILAIDGRPQANWESVLYSVLLRPDSTLHFRIRRGQDEQEVTVRSRRSAQKTGEVGIAPLVRIGQILSGAPAARAGLRADDGVIRIDDQPIHSFDEIPPLVRRATGRPLQLRVLRDLSFMDVSITPENGRIGIGSKTIVKKFGPAGALREAFGATARLTQQTVAMFRDLITARVSPKAALSGPLGIAQASGDAARSGWLSLMFLIAAISLSVGILNLFPLAPLDGGHLAILAGEALIRRDFSTAVKAWIMNAGTMVLFLLMGIVIYSDLSKTHWLGKYLP